MMQSLLQLFIRNNAFSASPLRRISLWDLWQGRDIHSQSLTCVVWRPPSARTACPSPPPCKVWNLMKSKYKLFEMGAYAIWFGNEIVRAFFLTNLYPRDRCQTLLVPKNARLNPDMKEKRPISGLQSYNILINIYLHLIFWGDLAADIVFWGITSEPPTVLALEWFW